MSDIVDERNANALLGEIERLQEKLQRHEDKFEELMSFILSVQSSLATLSDQVMGLLVSRAVMEQELAVLTERVNDGDND